MRGSKEKHVPEETLRRWVYEANYELLPTEKSVELFKKIPRDNLVRITCKPTQIEDTVRFVESIDRREVGRLVPHIAARRIVDEAHLENVLERLLRSGVRKLFVVGGDGKPFGKYGKCEEILTEISKRGILFDSIGIGGYPEGNPVYDVDPTEVLLRKQEIGELTGMRMEIVTQMCFDPQTLLQWLEDIRARGVHLPVVLGVPGKIKIRTLFNVLPLLGVTDVMAFMKSKPLLAKALIGGALGGFNPEELLRQISNGYGEELNVKGLSVFTLGSVTNSVKTMESLGR